MTRTSHNHWIGGTPYAPWTGPVERCGGPGICTVCSLDWARAPKSTTCLDHAPKQHRDARPPWCKNCGLTGRMSIPYSRFEEDKVPYLLALKGGPLDPAITAPRKEQEAPTDKARRLVVQNFNESVHRSDDFELQFEQTYVVSYCYVLGGWKAMVSTDVPDNMYYEVTHDKAKAVTYVDAYVKLRNQEYPELVPAGVGG